MPTDFRVHQARHLSIAQIAPLWHPVPPQDYGGAERIVSWLSEWLHRRGHRVTLVASGDSSTSADLYKVLPQSVCRLMEEGSAQSYDHYIAASVGWAMRNQRKFDIIHFHVEPRWLPVLSAINTPSVLRLYTALSIDDIWAINHSPDIQAVAISNDQLQRAPSSITRNIPVIYNGCDFDQFEFCEKPEGYLLFLGRMGQHKNPLGAIKVAKSVGMPLILAGAPENRQETDYFESRVRPWIDGKEVRYMGKVGGQQKIDLLRRAAALLFPILWAEPFGIVMIEAMASGTPVLALRNGSVTEVVDNGVTGFVEDDLQGLSLRVEQTVALSRKLVRSHAQARFGLDRMGSDYEALYRKIVTKRKDGLQKS